MTNHEEISSSTFDLKKIVFRTEQHRPRRCDPPMSWCPKVAVWRHRVGVRKNPCGDQIDRCSRDNGYLRHNAGSGLIRDLEKQPTPICLTKERLANLYLSIILLAVTLAVGGLKYSSRAWQRKPDETIPFITQRRSATGDPETSTTPASNSSRHPFRRYSSITALYSRCLTGSFQTDRNLRSANHWFNCAQIADNIKQKLKKFWKLDSIGIQHHEKTIAQNKLWFYMNCWNVFSITCEFNLQNQSHIVITLFSAYVSYNRLFYNDAHKSHRYIHMSGSRSPLMDTH
ncbi:hypothetical protein T07_855 [Trichinella nelsoni]|uniref:Uncharacterized protein n=1 Tax=Trichinella nelsoni TaxID=6336 RepID=A0A0V0SJB4_9BILA|nr:hypothetical protein T07_855 [Trichinella nelsoni]